VSNCTYYIGDTRDVLAMVATGLGRDAILIDLDERNVDLARDRIGMFLTVTDTREAAS